MIQAECHDDAFAVEAKFDATPYFEQTTDAELTELVACDFGGDYPADEVARFFEDNNDEVAEMFRYIEKRQVGFECYVDIIQAEAWIKVNRPQLAKELGL